MISPAPIWFLFDPRQKALSFATRLFHAVKKIANDSSKFEEMGFGDMWKTPQIQAADILVYESVRRRCELQHNPRARMRPSLNKLLSKNRVLLQELEESSLYKYIEFVRRSGTSSEGRDG
jgi:hypothetical protein